MKAHPDFEAFINALNRNRVDFVVVGAFALARLGHPRATGDLGIWIRPTAANATALFQALRDFGFTSLKLSQADVLSGKVIQLGYPPVRLDLLTTLNGLKTEEIWESRESFCPLTRNL